MKKVLHEFDPGPHPASWGDQRPGGCLPSGEKDPTILQLISPLLNAWGYSPRLAAADRDGPPGTDKSFSRDGTGLDRKKYRILIIEDDFASLELYSYLLKAVGYTTLLAGNGEQGLTLARRTRPDLIICDVKLPKMDGVEVVRHLKNEPTLAQIPIVAVTAQALAGDRERLLAAGFDDYLSKPIEVERFIDHVRDFIAAKGGGKLH
jgi:two-component system cell cycle response regulator